MNRKVDYILTKVGHLNKKEKLEDALSELKTLNRYHFVATPDGRVIQLKNVEENLDHDTNIFKVECIHLYILMPPMSFLKMAFYLMFRVIHLGKKLQTLFKDYPEALVEGEQKFYEDCRRKMDWELIETAKKIIDLESQLRDLKGFGMSDYQQN